MTSVNRLDKLKNKNLTVNKTYPPYIINKIFNGYEVINPIDYDTMQNELEQIPLSNSIREKSPYVYKNTKTNKYYIRHMNFSEKYQKYIFDITDDYDWYQVIKYNTLDYSRKISLHHIKHLKGIWEDKIYYPGSPEYDIKYPPVKKE